MRNPSRSITSQQPETQTRSGFLARASGWCVLVLLLALIPQASAQDKLNDYVRTSPRFLQAFEEVSSKYGASIVRVQADGKNVALGLIVEADGWVLTHFHDLKDKLSCRLSDGRTLPAQLIGVHEGHDLAILKIEAKGLVAASLADSKNAFGGSWVVSLAQSSESPVIGVISVPTRNLSTRGPQAMIDPSKSGYLGVSLEQGENGARISSISEATPASKAGLKVDDVIRNIDGTPINIPDDLINTIGSRKPGDIVTLIVKRGNEEKEYRITLQPRPLNPPRTEMQNHMGSELSKRRSGYSTVLQHDSVIKPSDCGGPLVDLEGRIIGINISRVGRVESYAIPAEVALALLPDLKAGKLPPKLILSPAPNPTEPGLVEPAKLTQEDGAIDTLLGAMHKRLKLMPEVAKSRWNGESPRRDENREMKILESMSSLALERKLERDVVATFFSAQIDAAWMSQEKLFAEWKKARVEPSNTAKDLRKELRPKIDEATQELFEAFVRLQPLLDRPGVRDRLRVRSATLLIGDSISPEVRQRAMEPLLKTK